MSAGIINVLFSTMKGSKYPGQLNADFSAADIRKLVQQKFGSDNYRLITNGKEIQDNDATSFAEIKKTIKNNSIIYVCQRMDGGSGMLDVGTHQATILNDLEIELKKLSCKADVSVCMICMEERQCLEFLCGKISSTKIYEANRNRPDAITCMPMDEHVVFHCKSIICKQCFPYYFVRNRYQLRCLTCDAILPPEAVFKNRAFIDSLNELDETNKLVRNIDFQICNCGAFSINSTMFAQQQCTNCQRWLCFFCNSDWNETERGMRNNQYSCGVNCFWETKIKYHLVPLEMNRAMQVPNRRCCPKCFECGAYGNKCKFHTCKCGYQFCFICLEAKAVCETKYKSCYNKPCTAIAQQTFAMFPRLCS